MVAFSPRIISVDVLDDDRLRVMFDNGVKIIYNAKPLFQKGVFTPLRDETLFRSVRVDRGGDAVVWNDDFNLAEFALWENGAAVSEAI